MKQVFDEKELLKYWKIIKLDDKKSPAWRKGFLSGLAYAKGKR